jgi:hypothetical protein
VTIEFKPHSLQTDSLKFTLTVLWHTDPLLEYDRGRNKYTTAVTE